MISLRCLYFASLVFIFLLMGHPASFAQDVVGYTAVLQSTNSSEIDGYSLTETSYAVAYYYDAGVIGYLFDGSLQVDQKAGTGTGYAEAYPMTTSVHQGDTYTVYSEHYLIAYYYTPGLGYYNPYEYYPGSGFMPGDPGYAPGSGFTSGGGSVIVQQEIIYLGYTYKQFSTAPPRVSSNTPSSVSRGDSGTFNLKGSNLQDDFGVFTVRPLDGDNIFVAWSDQSSASLNYSIAANAALGTHRFTISNTWGESEPVSFTVNSGWPVNPCDVSSSPNSRYTSIASTGTIGGTGTMTVSFSGAAYSAVSQTVSYGPHSTPSSVAANIAALITANYTQYGLTARAFGSNIVYSGTSAVGTVNYVTTGPSYTPIISPAAEAASGMACMLAPQSPPPVCAAPNPLYVVTVLNDTVKWKDDGLNYGRFVNYSLEYSPTSPNALGAPTNFQSTITEHLTKPMSFGLTSSGTISGQFTDVLGNIGGLNSGTYTADRCFTVTSPTMGNLGHVQSYDAAGRHQFDQIKITLPRGPSILNNWTNPDGSPKDIKIP